MTHDSNNAPDYAGRSGAHTPGPWFYGISYEPERGPVPFDYESPGYYENSGILAADGTTVVGCGEYTIFNSPEDARLMVAAPDMLAALKIVNTLIAEASMTGFNCHDGDWAERLFHSQQATSKAIAKAEGRQS